MVAYMNIKLDEMQKLLRAFERDRALSKGVLDDIVRSTWLYALRLAATPVLVTRSEQRIDISRALEPFRVWLLDEMRRLSDDGWKFTDAAQSGVGTRFWAGKWHRETLISFYPTLAKHLRQTLSALYTEFPAIDEFVLGDALAHKQLGLALGGGGGTGFVHQSLFQLLEANDIRPAIMTGTSIGSLMGLLRAIQPKYDAAMTVLHMPSWLSILRSMTPCLGNTRHGLRGMFRVDFAQIIESVTPYLGWPEAPRFSQLKIPFACVSTGILRDSDVIQSIEAPPKGLFASLRRFTHTTFKNSFEASAQLAHALTSANAVREVVLGFDSLTRELSTTEGVPFSALVPGCITYDVPRNHYQSREILDEVFKRDGLYRLTDGGMVSNVPVRALQREIDTLRLGHSNVHIVGIDVFAPQMSDIFYPLQQIANSNADIDAHAAASFIRLKHLLSPVNLAPSLSQFKWLNSHFSQEFATELKVIQYVTKPLRPLSMLDLLSF